MIGYLALRTSRVLALGCGPTVALILAIGLAITFWYVTLPVAVVLGSIAYGYRRHMLAQNAEKRRIRSEADRLAA